MRVDPLLTPLGTDRRPGAADHAPTSRCGAGAANAQRTPEPLIFMQSRSSTRTRHHHPPRCGSASASTTSSLPSLAPYRGADALVLLSNVDGLYDSDPGKVLETGGARLISGVLRPADLDRVVAGRGSHLGTGAMASKLSSALLAADADVTVLLAAASDAATALVDASVGTVFAPRPGRMSARRFWVVTPQRHLRRSRSTMARCGQLSGSGGLLPAGSPRCRAGSRR